MEIAKEPYHLVTLTVWGTSAGASIPLNCSALQEYIQGKTIQPSRSRYIHPLFSENTGAGAVFSFPPSLSFQVELENVKESLVEEKSKCF